MIDHKVILDFFGPWGWRVAHVARQLVWRITRPQRLGVFAVVFNPAGQVLLVENSYASGWRLPGGGVERGETIEASLLRELKEEVQISAVNPKFQGIYLMMWSGASNQIISYVVESYEGEARADGIEILRIMWADPKALPLEMEAGAARRIREATEGAAPSPRW